MHSCRGIIGYHLRKTEPHHWLGDNKGHHMAATRAFVLIETAVGKTKEVVSALSQTANVQSVNVVTGGYDIIVIVESADLASVGDTVTSYIHTIPGITRTVTCLAVS
jgi:DNA-binding Lrp family transcriptional regulator